MKYIYFVRHGETDANLNRYVPSKKEPLNDTGIQQANDLAERLSHLDFEKIISSDFVRSQQTAQPIIARQSALTEIIPECGEVIEPSSLFGVHEYEEQVQAHRRGRNGHVEDPSWRMEDGENFTDVFARIEKVKKIIEAEVSNNILVNSHSFFMTLFAAAILTKATVPTQVWFEVACTLKISNVGISLFTYDEQVWRLVIWNDHAHFAE